VRICPDLEQEPKQYFSLFDVELVKVDQVFHLSESLHFADSQATRAGTEPATGVLESVGLSSNKKTHLKKWDAPESESGLPAKWDAPEFGNQDCRQEWDAPEFGIRIAGKVGRS
jgi:hypothetical protein